jgi:hypothetical protein
MLQFWQAEAPLALYLPGLQSEHAVDALPAASLPAGHAEHVTIPASRPYRPGAQSMHVFGSP